MKWLVVIGGVAAVVAILWTMPIGSRVARALGLREFGTKAVSSDDRDYLLRICEGDPGRVRDLLDEARRHNPEMSEAEAYRKAIRGQMKDRW